MMMEGGLSDRTDNEASYGVRTAVQCKAKLVQLGL